MIAFLDGTLAAKTPDKAFVDVRGIGFAVAMSSTDIARLPEKDSHVTIFTHMAVRDDGISLYGFLTQEAQGLFEKLISVSGIGPKVALAALSTFPPRELAGAIAAQDLKMVSTIPGVGKKTAQRIILELQGSIQLEEENTLISEARRITNEHLKGAYEALLAMGFSSQEAEVALRGAPEDAASEGVLLQYALKRLDS